MLRREVEFVSLRVELSRELAKFFLCEQIEGVVACRPAPGSKSAEIASGHGLPPKTGPPLSVWARRGLSARSQPREQDAKSEFKYDCPAGMRLSPTRHKSLYLKIGGGRRRDGDQ